MDIRTHRGAGRVTIETETRVMQPQTKGTTEDFQEPPASKSKEKIFPLRLPREHGFASTLILDFWGLGPSENWFLLFKPLCLWYFLTVALQSKYTCITSNFLFSQGLQT